ncbi:SRPBCC domain-containing protein [Roseomonas sp. WA12]
MAAMETGDEAERGFTITRVFEAPARLLFEAHSRPEHVKRWFGPVGWPLTLCEMDFRVGGTFRFAMTGPDGRQNTPFGGTYREIVPDRRIVFDNGFLVPGAGRMVHSIGFEETPGELGPRTLLTHHTLFGSVEMKAEHLGLGFEGGVGSGLDQLETLVAGMVASTGT